MFIFFRPLLRRWKDEGVPFTVVCRNIETVRLLLTHYDIPFMVVSEPRRGRIGLGLELLEHTWKLAAVMRKARPQKSYSIGGTFTVIASKMLGIPSDVFTDTDTAGVANKIMAPFATNIYTPRSFAGDFGAKHQRYDGLHEMAYLSEAVFQPNPTVLEKYGLKEKSYALVRYISWGASHDLNVVPATSAEKQELLGLLAEEAQPFLVHESEISIDVEDYHDLLYFAKYCISEGGSTALEAGVLGVPVFYMNPLRPGVIVSVAEGLNISLSEPGELLRSFRQFLSDVARGKSENDKFVNPHELID